MRLSKNTIRQEIEQLVALRIRKGISLSAIEEETKIRVEYLTAIEEGRFEKLPDGVYRINYLKQYAGQIDPFDGGPHFSCRTDDIEIVRGARQVATTIVADADAERPWAIVAVEGPQGFCATGARIEQLSDDEIGISSETQARLGIGDGAAVWMALG